MLCAKTVQDVLKFPSINNMVGNLLLVEVILLVYNNEIYVCFGSTHSHIAVMSVCLSR